MTTTYETAVTLVEQLSPVDQARLVVLLAERLQHTLQTEPSPVASDTPPFWQLLIDDVESPGAESLCVTVQSSNAPAHTETQAMVAHWFGELLSEEDALDLAMSTSIAEWNLDA